MRVPMECVGEDERDGADELDYAEDCPCIARQGAEGGDVVAYLVEHEDFHDAGGEVEERGENLQDP